MIDLHGLEWFGRFDKCLGGGGLPIFLNCTIDGFHQIKLTQRVKFSLFYASLVVGVGVSLQFYSYLSQARLGLRLSLAKSAGYGESWGVPFGRA